MRIGYDAKRFFHNKTGLGNYSRDLIKSLATHYPEHLYLLYNPKSAQNCPDFVTDFHHVVERKPRGIFSGVFSGLWRQKGIVSDVQKDKIKIFHGLSGEVPFGLQATDIATVVSIHDIIFITHPQYYKAVDRKIYEAKLHNAITKSDKIVCVSNFTKQQLIEGFNVPEEKTAVIYQTCHEAFKVNYTNDEIQALKTKYQLPEEYLLNVGTIEQRKNTLPLVEAMTSIDLPLVLVGRKTDYFKQLEQIISDKNLQHKVHVLEDVALADLALIYQGAKLFVYTSLIEGFGIPLIEAGFSGVPILCNASGVFPEAAGPHSCLVEDLSSEHLAMGINELLNNPDELHKMSIAGKEYAKHFDEQKIARQWMQLYESILKN